MVIGQMRSVLPTMSVCKIAYIIVCIEFKIFGKAVNKTLVGNTECGSLALEG